MTLKTYKAPTMAAALDEVRRDLGRDAVILHTRPFRKGGLFGVGGRKFWEVTASTGVNVPPRPVKGRYVGVSEPDGRSVVPGEAAQGVADTPQGGGLAKQVRRLREMLSQLLERGAERPDGVAADALSAIEEHLVGQDVRKDIARDVAERLRLSLTGEQVNDAALVRSRVRDIIAGGISTASPLEKPVAGRARVIALIGPTGVGKTTTIAKLAANYHLHEGRRVGLITMDTYRIAAVEQLRTYA